MIEVVKEEKLAEVHSSALVINVVVSADPKQDYKSALARLNALLETVSNKQMRNALGAALVNDIVDKVEHHQKSESFEPRFVYPDLFGSGNAKSKEADPEEGIFGEGGDSDAEPDFNGPMSNLE